MLLSSSPCCADGECFDASTQQCSENNQDNTSSDVPDRSCSPLMVCGSCAGFVLLAVNAALNPETVIADNQIPLYIQLYPDNYCLKFWQPPKIGE